MIDRRNALLCLVVLLIFVGSAQAALACGAEAACLVTVERPSAHCSQDMPTITACCFELGDAEEMAFLLGKVHDNDGSDSGDRVLDRRVEGTRDQSAAPLGQVCAPSAPLYRVHAALLI